MGVEKRVKRVFYKLLSSRSSIRDSHTIFSHVALFHFAESNSRKCIDPITAIDIQLIIIGVKT